jgi:hypothetical protein
MPRTRSAHCAKAARGDRLGVGRASALERSVLRSGPGCPAWPRAGASVHAARQRSANGSPAHPSPGASSPRAPGTRKDAGPPSEAAGCCLSGSTATASGSAVVRRTESQPGMSERTLAPGTAPGSGWPVVPAAHRSAAGAPSPRPTFAPDPGVVGTWHIARTATDARASSPKTATRRCGRPRIGGVHTRRPTATVRGVPGSARGRPVVSSPSGAAKCIRACSGRETAGAAEPRGQYWPCTFCERPVQVAVGRSPGAAKLAEGTEPNTPATMVRLTRGQRGRAEQRPTAAACRARCQRTASRRSCSCCRAASWTSWTRGVSMAPS